MLEFLGEINLLLGVYLIKGIFISVLLIMLVRFLLNNIIETEISTQIIRWIIIVSALFDFAVIILTLVFANTDTSTFERRSTGAYWWSYLTMIFFGCVAPLLLLNKRMGRNLSILFIVALMMNIGWLFEAYVIHSTSIHRDYVSEGYNPYLPNQVEIQIILNGLIVGISSLIIGNGVKKVKRQVA